METYDDSGILAFVQAVTSTEILFTGIHTNLACEGIILSSITLDALDGQRPLPPVHIQVESLVRKGGQGNVLLYVRCDSRNLGITEVA